MGQKVRIGPLIPIYFLGEETDIHAFVDNYDNLENRKRVTGIVTKFENAKGWMRLSSGQEVSFRLDNSMPETIVGHEISGNLGFRFEGLGLYGFNEEERVREKIENDYYATERAEEKRAYQEDYEKKKREKEDSELIKASDQAKEMIKLTPIKKIDLPEDRRSPKEPLIPGNEYIGTIVIDLKYVKKVRPDRDKYETDRFRFDLSIEGNTSPEFKKGDEVFFTLASKPNAKNPERSFYYAKDVRLKE